MSKGTPVFTFRLPPEERKSLIEIARLFGSPNTSVFLREMVGSICSGDQKRIGDFMGRLVTKMGEQLALDFAEKVRSDAAKRSKTPKLKRGGTKRGRTT